MATSSPPEPSSARQRRRLSSADPTHSLNQVPCQNCRQRKIKCDRTLPQCHLCCRANVLCTYSTSKQRPGLRAGYVQRLEQRIATLEDEFRAFKQGLNTVNYDIEPDAAAPTLVTPNNTFPAWPTINHGDPLDKATLTKACEIWFDRYHSWLPILHRPSTLAMVESTRSSSYTDHPIVLKAILVTVDSVLFPQGFVDTSEHQNLTDRLAESIISETLSTPACSSLQALLILSVKVFGDGHLIKFWNLISLSKRISMQLGLHDLVVHYCSNFGKSSLLPPRMLLVPSSDVELEERIRAYWVAEVLDSASTIGASWNFHIAPPEFGPLSPCEDDSDWSSDPIFVRLFPVGPSQTPSTFAQYVGLVRNELWHCHRFHQKACDLTIPQLYTEQTVECQAMDEKLSHWLDEFQKVAPGYNSTTPVSPGDSRLERPNVNAALIFCMVDLTIITLYQRLIYQPSAEDAQNLPEWPHAKTRCLAACDHMAYVLRELPDTAMECASPQFIICIFVAARYYIIDSLTSQRHIPAKLHFLKYALSCCGYLWKFARRLNKVLLAAETSFGQQNNLTEPLPPQFWDLQYSWQDIDHALQLWATKQEQ